MQPIPVWAEATLQGLAYWDGYKTELFPHYHLSEGAVAAELHALIYAHTDRATRVECESHCYKDHNHRADITIVNQDYIDEVIEVKIGGYRGNASRGLLLSDLRRLSAFKKRYSDTRCFLLYVSQSKHPNYFVDKNGNASRKPDFKLGQEIAFSVRRVCKAYESKRQGSGAHFVCLIEVF